MKKKIMISQGAQHKPYFNNLGHEYAFNTCL